MRRSWAAGRFRSTRITASTSRTKIPKRMPVNPWPQHRSTTVDDRTAFRTRVKNSKDSVNSLMSPNACRSLAQLASVWHLLHFLFSQGDLYLFCSPIRLALGVLTSSVQRTGDPQPPHHHPAPRGHSGALGGPLAALPCPALPCLASALLCVAVRFCFSSGQRGC